MKAIIAVNNLGFIGFRGGLPWKSRKDMRHFAQKTDGCKLLVGNKTRIEAKLWELKNRQIIFLSHKGYSGMTKGEQQVYDLEHALIYKPDWCIGGKSVYELCCHLFTELHISHINDDTIGDCLFPDFSNLNPDCKIFNYNFEVDKKG